MRVGDCPHNVQKQFNAFIYIEFVLIAILVDLFSFYMLENEIRLSSWGDAGVDQFRDVRVRELAENPALAFESFSRCARSQGKTQKLQRYLAFEAAIRTLGQPHVAHSAFADAINQFVGAEVSPG